MNRYKHELKHSARKIAAFILTFLIIASAFTVGASAQDEITWSLDGSVLTISGTGAISDFTALNADRAPWRSCEGIAKSLVIGDGISGVGAYSFYNFIALESVTVSNSAMRIGANAFTGCTEIKSVTLGNNLRSIESDAFSSCGKLTSLELPERLSIIFASSLPGNVTNLTVNEKNVSFSVENGILFSKEKEILIMYPRQKAALSYVVPISVKIIGSRAFQDCDLLTSVVLPEGLLKLEDSAFLSCDNLRNINVPGSVTSISNNIFLSCQKLNEVNLCEGLKTVSTGMFSNCTALENITIPQSVTSIGSGAFKECSKLKNVNIPKGVKSIGQSAFYACSEFTDITIPDNVVALDDYAYYGCNKVESIYIGSGVNKIEKATFTGCNSLSEISVSENNLSFSSDNGVLFNKEKSVLIQYPRAKTDESYTLPESVKAISANAFYFAQSLKNLTFSDCLESIGDKAFWSCTQLLSPSFPDSVKDIGESAFWGCTAITDLSLPPKIAEVKDYTFYNCSALKNVAIPDAVKTIGKCAFALSPLESVSLPSSVTVIKDEAFCGCNMTGIVIPDSVTVMGKRSVGYTYPSEKIKGFVISGSACRIAGEYAEENGIDFNAAVPHKLRHVTVENTCLNLGADYDICEVCGRIFNYVSATQIPHTPVLSIPAKAATCTQFGNDEEIVCAVCATVLKESVEIQPLGHSDENNDGYCDVCGEELYEHPVQPQPEKQPTFFDKIRAFFQKIIDWFNSIFK